jgi:RNA polymerase sigma-70 factor (ECF subfamily)
LITDFHTLYQTYAPLVRRFAVFLCGDPALADDITSDTFVRAWRSQEKIREATVKAYLFTIARNLYRDYLRRQKPMSELNESMPDSSLDLHIRAEQKAEVRELMSTLQQFPEIDRSALLMRVQEEMTYEEIAHALELPLSSVKVKIHRLRLKLIKARAAVQEVRS